MTPIGTGQRELTELMPNHILRDKNWYMLTAVVDCNRQADHLWQDHRASRPSLDGPFVVLCDRIFHLLRQMVIDKRPFSD